MTARRVLAAASLVCALSTTADAEPITVGATFWGGAGPLDATGIAVDMGSDYFQGFYLHAGDERHVQALVGVRVTAPLLSAVSRPAPQDDTTDYTFGATDLQLEATWFLDDGSWRTGTFTAPLAQPVLTVFAGGFWHAYGTSTFGPGLFDPALATLLGVSPVTTGGELFFQFDIDSIDNQTFPALPYWLWANESRVTIAAQTVAPARAASQRTVPEPSLLALLGLGLAGAAYRRRALDNTERGGGK